MFWPGSDQICIDGDDSVIGAENHAASSFYQFWQDEEGRWHIRCDADGNTALIPGTREDSMVYLHEFTTFIINVMPEDERERAGDYIGIFWRLFSSRMLISMWTERDIHRTIL